MLLLIHSEMFLWVRSHPLSRVTEYNVRTAKNGDHLSPFFHFLATKKEWIRGTSKWIVFCQLLIVSSNTYGANKGTGRCCVLWNYLGARALRNRTDKKDPSRFVSKLWCLSYTDQRRTKKLWVWQCYLFAFLFLCSETNPFPFPSNQTNKKVKKKTTIRKEVTEASYGLVYV